MVCRQISVPHETGRTETSLPSPVTRHLAVVLFFEGQKAPCRHLLAKGKKLSIFRRENLLCSARTYCSCITYSASLRPSPIATRPSLESHFLILLSSFSFFRRPDHFFLHDLSRTPTNFWRGSLLPLTPYFLAAILLSSRCVLFSAFYHCLLAQLRTKHCQFSPISQSAITLLETHSQLRIWSNTC